MKQYMSMKIRLFQFGTSAQEELFRSASGRATRRKWAGATAFWWIAFGLAALAQTPTLKVLPQPTTPQGAVMASGQKQPTSLPHLYLHFLRYQNHLDRAAAALQQKGKDGTWLANHFQQRLGFTDAQFALVRQTAQRLESELKTIEGKAKVIVQSDRAWAIATGVLNGDGGAASAAQGAGVQRRPLQRRPGWAQLQDLQQQHETTIQNEISNLKTGLGPQLAAKLDSFLQNHLARQVTSTHFQPGPQPHVRPPQAAPEVHP